MKLSKLQWVYAEVGLLVFFICVYLLYLMFTVADSTITQIFRDMVANETTIFMTVEVCVLLLVALVWMKIETDRLGMPRYWLYALLCFLPSPAVGVPIFLCVRERYLGRRAEGATRTRASLDDTVSV